MNLTGDPWVPVTLLTGQSTLVSLREVFARKDEIRDLALMPPQRIAVTRLLLCIAQAALDGPETEVEWRDCKPRIAPACLDYLTKWQHAFELYASGSHGAFLQVPNLEETHNAVLDKLDFGLSAGNNSTLFDHEASPEGRQQSPAWQALMLLTFQCFSPGGLIGVTKWKGSSTTKSSNHAPCIEGSPLHTYLRGEALLDTIHLNLLTKQIVRELPGGGWGIPTWESVPAGSSDGCVELLTTSYLGRLAPISRAIRLSPGSQTFTLANGLSYPRLPLAREPALAVMIRKNNEPGYISVNPSRHPWRELSAILAISPRNIEGGAIALQHLRNLEGAQKLSIWTGGLTADKAKLIDTAEWSFDLEASLLGESALHKYERGVELATQGELSLKMAVKICLKDLGINETAKAAAKAALSFWGRLDGSYGVLLDAADDETASLGGAWYRLVRQAMSEAYDRACPHETPRQIRAFAKGTEKLRLARPEAE
jgi:CRISPR system Cascade subunit CasA